MKELGYQGEGLPWWSSAGADCDSNAGGPLSIPAQGPGSHMLQLSSQAMTKTWHSQRNKY